MQNETNQDSVSSAVTRDPPMGQARRFSASAPVTCDALALELEIARIDLVYRQNILGVAALVLYSVTYAAVSWDDLSRPFLIIWLGSLLLSAVLRLVGSRLWHQAKDHLKTIAETRKWLLFIHVMLLISGLGWCAIGLRFGLTTSLYQQLITALCVFFMSAGAIVCYAASPMAVYVVVIPATLGMSLPLMQSNEIHTAAVGLLVFIYTILGVISSRTLSGYFLRSLRINLENSQLAIHLRQQVETRVTAQTKLEETQTRLEMALQSSNAFIWEWDPQTDSITSEGKTLSAATYLERFQPEDRVRFHERLWQMARFDQNLDDEFCGLREDGQRTYWAYRGRSHRPLGEREVFTVTGIYWDVTERRMQATLRRERDIYEAANQAKSIFLANASHEIRTPLASINGFAELLLQNMHDLQKLQEKPQQASGEAKDNTLVGIPSAAEMGRDLQVILRNGKYLTSLVNDLLDLSKIESHRLDIQKTRVSISREIEDAILMVRAALEAKQIRLHLNYQSKIPEFFESDGVRIRQILINLLSNASKFTKAGSVEIDVSFRSANEASGMLSIVVRDTGIGLSDKEQRQLFQTFVRGESAEAQNVQGSGLGLALSQELARLLGGNLRLLRSVEGQGSEFEFTLAVAMPTAASLVQIVPHVEWGSGSAKKVPNTTGVLDGVEILVVDDAPDLRSLMRRFLEKHGARVTTTENGQQAVERAAQSVFDIVLMDMKMPVMNGYEATRVLRQQGFRRPIIAITAHANPQDRQECYEAGCDDYLSKPIDAAQLVQTLSHRIHFEKDLMV